MNNIKITLIGLLLLFTAISCNKKEKLGMEADITSFSFPENIQVYTTLTNDQIDILVKTTDMTQLTPTITVSEGAIVSPASGVAQDFTNSVIYTVTSEDGKQSKKYTIRVMDVASVKFTYDFEDWGLIGSSWKYPALNDITWQSANSGIAVAKAGNVEEYPTHSTNDCYSGTYAAQLKTVAGGTFFGIKIPIFSGSLFRGKFELNQSDVLKSTKFGQIHVKEFGKPTTFSGYYKYTPGETFITPSGEIPDSVDQFSIYAVLFQVTKGATGQDEYLNGSNVMNSDKLVAKAILEDRSPKENFTYFSIPFTYTKEINYDLYDYKLAVVFASSRNGDKYEGAPGSTLIVDEAKVECTPFQ